MLTNFILKNPKYEISRKIRLVRAALFHANGRLSDPYMAILIINEKAHPNLRATTNFQAKGSRGGGAFINPLNTKCNTSIILHPVFIYFNTIKTI